MEDVRSISMYPPLPSELNYILRLLNPICSSTPTIQPTNQPTNKQKIWGRTIAPKHKSTSLDRNHSALDHIAVLSNRQPKLFYFSRDRASNFPSRLNLLCCHAEVSCLGGNCPIWGGWTLVERHSGIRTQSGETKVNDRLTAYFFRLSLLSCPAHCSFVT